MPNGFIVPGGRFREFYYWDTYWIVRALLCFDMSATVKGIVENFLYMVDTHGLVPNGGRIYYNKVRLRGEEAERLFPQYFNLPSPSFQRSQPPFLTLMMREYMSKTAEVEFLRKHLPTLEKEMDFWERNRSVLVEEPAGGDDAKHHRVFVYGTGGTGPRPESYREDVEMAMEHFGDDLEEREEFYFHMKAGAETGWDYSTRWMINQEVRRTKMRRQ